MLELAEEMLADTSERSTLLWDGAGSAAVVSVPEITVGDERHGFGQAAARSALERLGLRDPAHGGGLSVSYTRGLAVAVAVVPEGLRIGVDLERIQPERIRLARRVLTSSEIEQVGEPASWLEILRRFCIKEAAYKALPPTAQRGLTFRAVEVERPRPEGVHLVRRVDAGAPLAAVAVASGSVLIVALAECTPSW